MGFEEAAEEVRKEGSAERTLRIFVEKKAGGHSEERKKFEVQKLVETRCLECDVIG